MPPSELNQVLDYVVRRYYVEATRIKADKELTLSVYLTRRTIHQLYSPKMTKNYPLTVQLTHQGKQRIANLSAREELMRVPLVSETRKAP